MARTERINTEDYRIKEYDGKFTIQRKFIIKTTSGYFRWTKVKYAEYWSRVNVFGGYNLVWRGETYIRDTIANFSKLSNAKAAIEQFKSNLQSKKVDIKYHYDDYYICTDDLELGTIC